MARKLARESAMKLVFERMMGGEGVGTLQALEEYPILSENDKQYIDRVLIGLRDQAEDIDTRIEKSSIDWKINRMPKVDLAILRLGAYEILYMEDIPPSVTANECVEIAKKYGEAKSPRFINGVLGNIIASTNEDRTDRPKK